jgi:hypothetical protein
MMHGCSSSASFKLLVIVAMRSSREGLNWGSVTIGVKSATALRLPSGIADNEDNQSLKYPKTTDNAIT